MEQCLAGLGQDCRGVATAAVVAQISNLLYRRLAVGRRLDTPQVANLRNSRLPICATSFRRAGDFRSSLCRRRKLVWQGDGFSIDRLRSGKLLNHPANLAAVCAFAGTLLGKPLESLAVRVEGKFLRLFGGLVRGRTEPSYRMRRSTSHRNVCA